MKRFSAVITLLAMVFTLCACDSGVPETPTDAPRSSGGYEYVLLADGSAKITKYTSAEEIITLDIPKELDGAAVTVIGERAFADVQSVTVINAPDGLVSVENEAFYASGVRRVFLHTSGVTSIGARAFSQCPNLIQVDMPHTLKAIGEAAFASSALLDIAYFRGDVESIAENAFDACPSVTVYAMDTYTNVLAYCTAHSLQTSVTESTPTTEFVFTQR